MDTRLILLLVLVIIIQFLLVYCYLYLRKRHFISSLEKNYLFDGWISVVIVILYVNNVGLPNVLMVIGFVVFIIIVVIFQKLYFDRNKLNKYELFFRKARDIRDFESFEAEFSKELFVDQSTNNGAVAVYFRKHDPERNVGILTLLTKSKELFYQHDTKKHKRMNRLVVLVTVILIAVFVYLAIVTPIAI